MRGIVRQAKQVKATARSLADLILELAQLEAKRNAATLGKAAGLGITAGVLAFYAVGFLLAAAAAGLNETLSLWLSLLIVAGAVLLVAVVLRCGRATVCPHGVATRAQSGDRRGQADCGDAEEPCLSAALRRSGLRSRPSGNGWSTKWPSCAGRRERSSPSLSLPWSRRRPLP